MKNLISLVLLFFSGLFDLQAQSLPEKPLQPNYEKWNKIKIGMPTEEVFNILGKPIARFPIPPFKPKRYNYEQRWIYGYVVKKPLMSFEIIFKKDSVIKIKAPFGGVPLSKDGKPTLPIIIIPNNNFIPSNPSIIDFRWFPSSGKYPMKYTVQIEHDFSEKWGGKTNYGEEPHPQITSPHFVLSGPKKFRWRLKAINDLGESNWTEFRYTKDVSVKDNIQEKISSRSREINKLIRENKYEVAISQLQNEIKNDTYYLSFCYNYMGVIYFYYKNQNDTALSYFKSAINSNHNFVFPYTNSGWIYLLNNDYKEALINFEKNIELNPSSGFGYFKVGLAYYYQGKYKKASNFFQKGMDVNPKDSLNILYKYFSDVKRGNLSQKSLQPFVTKKTKDLTLLAIGMFAEKTTQDNFLKRSSEITKNWSPKNKKRRTAEEFFFKF